LGLEQRQINEDQQSALTPLAVEGVKIGDGPKAVVFYRKQIEGVEKVKYPQRTVAISRGDLINEAIDDIVRWAKQNGRLDSTGYPAMSRLSDYKGNGFQNLKAVGINPNQVDIIIKGRIYAGKLDVVSAPFEKRRDKVRAALYKLEELRKS